MTGKRKKHVWTKLLSALVIASMLMSTISTYAFAAELSETEITQAVTEEAGSSVQTDGSGDSSEAPASADVTPGAGEAPAANGTSAGENPGIDETPEAKAPETEETPEQEAPISAGAPAVKAPEAKEDPAPETPKADETTPKADETPEVKAPGADEMPAPETPGAESPDTEEEKAGKVPQEVQEFLDAAEALPAPEDVTKENAQEVSAQTKAALDQWKALADLELGYEEREDVTDALETVEAVDQAAEEALAPEEPVQDEELSTGEDEEANPKETDAGKVPQEVQEFLDAVKGLPDSEDVTKENAEEIGALVNAVLDQWEALVDLELGYEEREDVTAAMDSVYALFEVVSAAAAEEEETDQEELDQAAFFAASRAAGPETSSERVKKSAFENAYNLGQSDTCYGIVQPSKQGIFGGGCRGGAVLLAKLY